MGQSSCSSQINKMNFKFLLAVFVVAVALMPTAHSQRPNRGNLAAQLLAARNRTSTDPVCVPCGNTPVCCGFCFKGTCIPWSGVEESKSPTSGQSSEHRITGYMSVTNRLNNPPAYHLTCFLALDQTLCSKAREEFKAIPNQHTYQYTDSDTGCKVVNIGCFPSTKKGTIIKGTKPCSLTNLPTNIFTVQTAGLNGDSCIIKPVHDSTPAANGQQ